MATREKPKSFFQVLKQTVYEWSEDRASTQAAALAYQAIFSLAPMAIIAIAIAGFFLGHRAARGEIAKQIGGVVGPNASAFIEDMIKNAYNAATQSRGAFAMILSVALLLYAATNLFASLQDSLDLMWHVQVKPGRTWWAMIRDRIWSFALVIGIGILLLAAMAAATFLSTNFAQSAGWIMALSRVGEILVSIAVFTGVFAVLFKYLPDVKIGWRDVIYGAIFTAVLFTAAKWGLGLYLGRASTTSTFGAAGSLVAIMLFIYFVAQIFFLGAKFTSVFARRNGRPIEPSENALCIEDAKRLEEEKKVQEGLKAGTPETTTVGGSAGGSSAGRPRPDARDHRHNGHHDGHPKAQPAREPQDQEHREHDMTVKSEPQPLGPEYPPQKYNLPGIQGRF